MKSAGLPSDQFLDRTCISHDPISREAAIAVWKRWHFSRLSPMAFRYWMQDIIRASPPQSSIETVVAVMQRAYSELSGVFPD